MPNVSLLSPITFLVLFQREALPLVILGMAMLPILSSAWVLMNNSLSHRLKQISLTLKHVIQTYKQIENYHQHQQSAPIFQSAYIFQSVNVDVKSACLTCPMWLPREEPSWRGLLGGCSPNKALSADCEGEAEKGERVWSCCRRTGGWPGWELKPHWLWWSWQTIVTVVSLQSFGRTILGEIMAVGVWKSDHAKKCGHV